MEKALLIEVDFSTGKRAGDINPKDPMLRCNGWQNLDSTPGLEIRLVEDDRDLSVYKDVLGVTILEGKDTINTAIQKHIPTKYSVKSEVLMLEHMKQRGILLDTLVGKEDIAKEAHNMGLAGVIERKPKLLE